MVRARRSASVGYADMKRRFRAATFDRLVL